MKKMLLGALVVVTTSFGQQPAEPPVAQVTYLVIDEGGQPVSGAKVGADFLKVDSTGTKGVHAESKYGTTDEKGVVTLSGHSNGYIAGGVSKNAYYWSKAKPLKCDKIVSQQWQPWNPTIEVLLKRIGNPAPMYAKQVNMAIAKFDEPVGFDLQECDWVAPNGKGKTSDILIHCTRRVLGENDFNSELRLSFPNPGDGIQPVFASHEYGSALVLPREAPQEGYLAEWKLGIGVQPDTFQQPSRADQNYFFRVRTVMENGRVVRSWYGKIHGEIEWGVTGARPGYLQFTYYLNPDTTRNLEFDITRNLFTNLKVTEQVKKP